MAKGQVLKYFWTGTLQDLHTAGVRIPEVVAYLLDQQPVWVDRADQEGYWETRHKLYKLVDNRNATKLYSDQLSEMKLPKKWLKTVERQHIVKYGNDRLREKYGYE